MILPNWLVIVAWLGVASGFVSACVIALDIAAGRRQHMWILNLVWPLTGLYSGALGLLAYYTIGRARRPRQMNAHHRESGKPHWQSIALGTTHCGAGCTSGDLVSEALVIVVPFTLFGRQMFGSWALDFVLAFVFGIAFQYFTIKPMRNLSPAAAVKAAIKADAASLIAWQVGMYGWMALATFVIFGEEIPKSSPVFWFMMQIAMLLGFATSFPVNAWLIRAGLKEAM